MTYPLAKADATYEQRGQAYFLPAASDQSNVFGEFFCNRKKLCLARYILKTMHTYLLIWPTYSEGKLIARFNLSINKQLEDGAQRDAILIDIKL